MELSCSEATSFNVSTRSGLVVVNFSGKGEQPAVSEGSLIALFTRMGDSTPMKLEEHNLINRPGEFEIESTYVQGIAVGDGSGTDSDPPVDIIYILNDADLRLGIFADISAVPDKRSQEMIGSLSAIAIDPARAKISPDVLAGVVRNLSVPLVLVKVGDMDDPGLKVLAKELAGADIQPQTSFTVKPAAASQDKTVVIALRPK